MEIRLSDFELMMKINDPKDILYGHYFSFVSIMIGDNPYLESVTLSPHQIETAFNNDFDKAKEAISIYLCQGLVESVPIEHKQSVESLFWPK